MAEVVQMESRTENENQSWETEKAYLTRLIETAGKRRADLEEKIHNLQDLVGQLTEARARNQRQEELARTFAAILYSRLAEWQSAIAGLVKQASQEMQTRLTPDLLFLQQPVQSDDIVGIADRFRKCLSLLNELNAFQNKITPTIELWTLEDGRKVLAKVIYIGLGNASYFIEESGDSGARTFTNGSWQSFPQSGTAKAVQAAWEAMEAGQKEGVYALPVKLTSP